MSTEKKNNYNPDITEDDLQALGGKEQNLRADNSEDESLKNREGEVDFVGKDLDVPGRTLPEDRDGKSLKDEENQLYSQGGEDNENLEQGSDHLSA